MLLLPFTPVFSFLFSYHNHVETYIHQSSPPREVGGGEAQEQEFGRSRSRRDSARVGIARPANISDPELLYWVKDPRNPIVFGK